jgi:aminopeptidase N
MGWQVEEYISKHAGVDLSKVFDQYLRTTKIPVLEYRIEGKRISYRWADVVPGFDMPLRVRLSGSKLTTIHPTESWQTAPLSLAKPSDFGVDVNFYVIPRESSSTNAGS